MALGSFCYFCAQFILHMWHRIAAFIIKFRIALLLFLLAATAALAFFASRVELSYEFSRAVPTDNPKYIAYQEFRQQFGEDGNLMVIGVQTPKFFETAFFSDYADLVRNLEKVSAVENVLSIPGAINLVKDTATDKLKVVRIFPEEGLVHTDSFRGGILQPPFL